MRNPFKPLLCFIMLICILAGCAQTAPTPTQEHKRVLRADASTFTSFEEMHEAIQKERQFPQQPIEGVVGNIEYYFLPAYIPAGYNLYQIKVDDFMFRCTYIWAEDPQSIDNQQLSVIRTTQQYFEFTFLRYFRENQMEYTARTNHKELEDLIDNKYLYTANPQTIHWEEEGHIHKLIAPLITVYSKEEVLGFGHVTRVDVPKQ